MSKFGFTPAQWVAIKKEALDILVETASRRALITYSELAAKMQTEDFEPHDFRLWEVIGEISRDEEAAGRGLLSVLVVHKHGDQEAGKGFLELAKYFGRNVSDKTMCFVDEVKRVHYYWRVTAKKGTKQIK